MLALLVGLLGTLANAGSQAAAAAPPDLRFFTVSYVEVIPSARSVALAAFQRYREAGHAQDGYIGFELFEQVDRPAHFAIVERWRDQKAFDAGGSLLRQGLLDALHSVRVSGLDQRPYKALHVDSSPIGATAGAVSVVTHVDVSPDPQVAAMLTRHAEVSRHDQGNLRFDVLQHTMRANHFTVIETWTSRKDLDEHAGAAHTRQYRDELQPFTGSPLDERVYKQLQ